MSEIEAWGRKYGIRVSDGQTSTAQQALAELEGILAQREARAATAARQLQLEEAHDLLWLVHKIFYPTSDVCSYCAGDASSLKHEQLITLIEFRVAALAALNIKPVEEEDVS